MATLVVGIKQKKIYARILIYRSNEMNMRLVWALFCLARDKPGIYRMLLNHKTSEILFGRGLVLRVPEYIRLM